MQAHAERLWRRLSPGGFFAYALVALAATFFAVPIVWLVLEARPGGHLGLWLFNSVVLLHGGSGDRRRILRSGRVWHCDPRVPRDDARC